jgi:UPF0755 protein
MKKFSFVIVFLVLLLGGVLAWFISGSSPVNSSDKTTRPFMVNKGESVRMVANNLKADGLIKDPVIFFIIVKRLGLDNKIQAGEFHLSPSMNATKIANALRTGTYDIQVVIPEGKRAEEVADILSRSVSTYDDSWRQQLIPHEGYLFPDTYSFPKDVTIDEVISIMRENFDEKYNQIPNSGRSPLPKEDIVILGSLIEREAKHEKDRPLVASVLFNRLRIGMPLQIDATVQYALGYQRDGKTWWKRDLTFADLKINSPYNTYIITGLPPGPIANPGEDVLRAVINPAKTDYLFYISDKSGNNHYAKTNEEHELNKKRHGL